MHFHEDKCYNCETHEDVTLLRRLRKYERRQEILFGITWLCISLLCIGMLWCIYQLYGTTEYVDSAIPMTTDLTTTYDGTKEIGSPLNKRFLFSWTLGLSIFRTVGFGMAVLGVEESCKTFHKAGGIASGALCVFGALSTAVTIGGRVAQTAQATANVATELQIANAGIQPAKFPGLSPPFKRDNKELNMSIINSVNERLTQGYGMEYRFKGIIHRNDTRNGHMVPDTHITWPVYELTNPKGQIFHHTSRRLNNNTHIHRLGHVNDNNKRDVYDNEHFSSGGIDFTACDNKNDPHQFNTGDFANVELELQCGINNLDSVSDFEYQIYDKTNDGTIGSGSVAPFGPNGKTRIGTDRECPSGLDFTGCGSKNSGGI